MPMRLIRYGNTALTKVILTTPYVTVWFSYETIVAVRFNGKSYVCENVWTQSTAKHLGVILREVGQTKFDMLEFTVFTAMVEVCKLAMEGIEVE